MERAQRISRSMMSYLKRAREQKEFLLKETREFERGKRHLANMMGIESQEMTQVDVDEAIKYLFPSGLFEPKARPFMKPPQLVYKAEKEAQFDQEGRPHHYLFYTTKPNYFHILNELSNSLREVNAYEDKQLAKGIINPPEEADYSFLGKDWITIHELRDRTLELITDSDYEYLIKSLNHLLKQPYSAQAKTFLDTYTREVKGQSVNVELPELLRDEETGHIYSDLIMKKREHKVRVKTVLNGSGKIDIEGSDILWFAPLYMRRSIFFPIQAVGMVDKVDIHARIVVSQQTLGISCVAWCIRQAVSRTLAAYVDPEMRERLRLYGLLTPDPRQAERKKFGQAGKRRKYTWKKR